jgi:hypothetical protein
MDATLFVAGLATALVAHQVMDHVFGQTDEQAANKAKPGRTGWSAILQHVGSYHVGMFIMMMTTFALFDLTPSVLGFTLFMVFSMASHALLDRRWTVRWILENTGSPNFAQMTTPLCGMYLADQGLHWLCLWISCLLLCL